MVCLFLAVVCFAHRLSRFFFVRLGGCKKYNFCKRLIINEINVLWRE